MIKKAVTDDKKIFIVLFLYTFTLLFFCSKMSPFYPFNEWSDINLYFNIGKGIFNGRVPYTESFDHKGPLIFIIYGLGYLISNVSFFGMYLIESLAWTCMVFTAYLTARLYVDKIYAYLVAILFPVLMLSHTSQGGSAEEFIAITQVISLSLFIKYFKDKDTILHKPAYMLIHGMLCAFVILTKINLIVFWVFPLLAIFIWLLLHKEYKNILQNIGTFIAGLLIVSVPVVTYLALNNALGEAWNVYIVLNKSYASMGGFSEVIERLAVRFYQRLRFEPFEFIIILIGAFCFSMEYIGNKWGKIALPLSFIALFSIIFMSEGYVFYYSVPLYIYVLPAGIALCKYIWLPNKQVAYIILAIIALLAGIKQKDFFEIQLSELKERKAPLIDEFSFHIMQEKNATLLNLGLDLGNGVFTKANIMPSVKYFISPNLRYDIYPVMRDEQTKYIENKEVQFIILGVHTFNYDYFSNLSALNENYTIIDSYDFPGYTTYYLYKRND